MNASQTFETSHLAESGLKGCMRLLSSGIAVLTLAAVSVACGSSENDPAASAESTVRTDSDASAPAATFGIDPVPLVFDGRDREVTYSPAAPFVAFEVHASAGASLAIIVDARTRGARPSVWLTDASFRTVASSATGQGTAFLTYDVPEAVAGKLFLVLRDASFREGRFVIHGTGGDPETAPAADAGTREPAPPAETDAGTRATPDE